MFVFYYLSLFLPKKSTGRTSLYVLRTLVTLFFFLGRVSEILNATVSHILCEFLTKNSQFFMFTGLKFPNIQDIKRLESNEIH